MKDAKISFYFGYDISHMSNSITNTSISGVKSSWTSLYRGKPGRWVGFEMNEFNVAKTLVVSRMIADESIPLEHVLQGSVPTVLSLISVLQLAATVENSEKCTLSSQFAFYSEVKLSCSNGN